MKLPVELKAARVSLLGTLLKFNMPLSRFCEKLPEGAKPYFKLASGMYFPYQYDIDEAVKQFVDQTITNGRKINSESFSDFTREHSKSAALRSCRHRAGLPAASKLGVSFHLPNHSDPEQSLEAIIRITAAEHVVGHYPTTVRVRVERPTMDPIEWEAVNWSDTHSGCASLLQAAGCLEAILPFHLRIGIQFNNLEAMLIASSTGMLPACACAAKSRLARELTGGKRMTLLMPDLDAAPALRNEVMSFYDGRREALFRPRNRGNDPEAAAGGIGSEAE